MLCRRSAARAGWLLAAAAVGHFFDELAEGPDRAPGARIARSLPFYLDGSRWRSNGANMTGALQHAADKGPQVRCAKKVIACCATSRRPQRSDALRSLADRSGCSDSNWVAAVLTAERKDPAWARSCARKPSASHERFLRAEAMALKRGQMLFPLRPASSLHLRIVSFRCRRSSMRHPRLRRYAGLAPQAGLPALRVASGFAKARGLIGRPRPCRGAHC